MSLGWGRKRGTGQGVFNPLIPRMVLAEKWSGIFCLEWSVAQFIRETVSSRLTQGRSGAPPRPLSSHHPHRKKRGPLRTPAQEPHLKILLIYCRLAALPLRVPISCWAAFASGKLGSIRRPAWSAVRPRAS